MALPHEVLGVPQNADAATINAAFRKAAKKYHPDLNGGSNAGIRHLRRLIAAREGLATQKKRLPDARAASYRLPSLRKPRGRKTVLFACALIGAVGLLAVPALLAHWGVAQPEASAVEKLSTTLADARIPDAAPVELKAIRDIQEADKAGMERAPEPRLRGTLRRRRFAQPANRFKKAVTQAAFLMSMTFRRLASQ